jgi:multiphosphoryl transfer protein
MRSRSVGGSVQSVAAVDGIAIGRAVVWGSDPEPRSVAGTPEEERRRLGRALVRVTRDVQDLARLLPPAEAELFAPEVAILDELGPVLLQRIDLGATAEEAVQEATSRVSTDLLLDARARLLDSLSHDWRSVEALLEGRDGDRVLAIESLTPSVVASLPARVVGIVAAWHDAPQRSEYTSHAVILARGRGIPVAFVRLETLHTISDNDTVVLDTTGKVASLWVSPDPAVVFEAKRRHEEWIVHCAQDEAKVAAPLAHLGLDVQVNIASMVEHVPASADGIGLVRTELVFSGHVLAPCEMEQFASLRAIAKPVGRAPVVIRLFDAGGDKPLPWLRPPPGSERAQGMELLFMHPAILDTQLRAIARAADGIDMRVLLPLVRSAGDVDRIREKTSRSLAVGAMIETPAAVRQVDAIAAAADFVCVGTNDLFARVARRERRGPPLSFDARALRMVERVIAVSHARGHKVSVCGEMASDPHGARILVGLGVDAISVAPVRFAKVKLSLRDVTVDDCRRVAQEAVRRG